METGDRGRRCGQDSRVFEGIVPRSALQRVSAGPPGENIIGRIRNQCVVATSADRVFDDHPAGNLEITSIAINIGESFRVKIDQAGWPMTKNSRSCRFRRCHRLCRRHRDN